MIITLDLHKIERGKGIKRIDTEFLKHGQNLTECQAKLTEMIPEYWNPFLKCSYIKMALRTIIMEVGKKNFKRTNYID